MALPMATRRVLATELRLEARDANRLWLLVLYVARLGNANGVHYSHRRRSEWARLVGPLSVELGLDWDRGAFAGEALLYETGTAAGPLDCVEVVPSGDVYAPSLWFIGKRAAWCSGADVRAWAEVRGYEEARDWARTGGA